MAKTIKFNLICDDKPIRTIEDLQNNFSIEDVLEYYNNKLLHRWLEVRGYSEEFEKVNAITTEKPIEIIKELIKIFVVVCDDKKVEESVYMLGYLNERKELCAVYDKENFKAKNIIDDYETGYRQLVNGILENPDNVAKIKSCISEITKNYRWILELDYRNLFYTLMDKSNLAIMCLLMNEVSRKYYLPQLLTDEEGNEFSDTESDEDKTAMFDSICELVKSTTFAVSLGDNIHTYCGETDGYWKDIEVKGKQYMIISMGNGASYYSSTSDYVRSSGDAGGDLSKSDIENKFIILDGIDYKSDSLTRQLMYMEV